MNNSGLLTGGCWEVRNILLYNVRHHLVFHEVERLLLVNGREDGVHLCDLDNSGVDCTDPVCCFDQILNSDRHSLHVREHNVYDLNGVQLDGHGSIGGEGEKSVVETNDQICQRHEALPGLVSEMEGLTGLP